ncbi:uncharacterized protein H6S33_009842, partial [Morchella sextelata]|uniref:uncharacterized protein n=1 Tax=Morchella sextelata TaxID=1174677 RepID=UPI001D03FE83
MATARLREDFYNIAYRSLQGTSDLLQQGSATRSHNIQTIKASGDRLLEVFVATMPTQNFLVVLVDSTKQIRTDLVTTNSN